jgi:aldehyde dehydrogenase (NAD+)
MPGVFTHKFDTPAFKGEVEINTGLFINGHWVDGSAGTTIEYATLPTIHRFRHEFVPVFSVFNPATEKLLTKVSEATAKDVNLAVEAARKAFDTTWGPNAPGAVRAALLNKLADAMEALYDLFCAVEALDNGPVFSS